MSTNKKSDGPKKIAGLIVVGVGLVALVNQLKSKPSAEIAVKPAKIQAPEIEKAATPNLTGAQASAKYGTPHLDPSEQPDPSFVPTPPLADATPANPAALDIPRTRVAPARQMADLPESVRNPKPLQFKQIGTAQDPRVQTSDGQIFRMLPLEAARKEAANPPEERRANLLSEKLKNKEYREALFPNGLPSEKKSSEGAYLMPTPGLLPRLFSSFFSVTGLVDAFAADPETEELVLLDKIQTPVRNQYSRRTCQTFGALAIVEATYLRDFGLNPDLDLSEQFTAHIGKSSSIAIPRFGNHESQSSYWGGGSSGGSTWVTQVYSTPLESEINYPFAVQELIGSYPDLKAINYLGLEQLTTLRNTILGPERGKLLDDWTQTHQDVVDDFEYDERYIPQSAREHARYRVKQFTELGGKAADTDTLMTLLRKNITVAVDLDFKIKFNPETGNNDFDPTQGPAGHVVTLVGFKRIGKDLDKSYMIVKNSWGGGPKDYIRLSFNCIRSAVYGGTYVDSVYDPALGTPYSTRWLGKWNLDNDGWRGKLVIRRIDADGKSFRLGSFYPADGSAEKTLTAVASNSGRSITFYQNDNIDVSPTVHTGAAFSLNQLTSSPREAAGFSTWQGRQYGMIATRDDLPQVGDALSGVDAWPKTQWALNFDGIPGSLSFGDFVFKKNQVIPHGKAGAQVSLGSRTLTASYAAQGAASQPVTVGFVNGSPHVVNLTIGKRKLRLMRFTWEDGRASAVTSEKAPVAVTALRK